MKFHMFPEKIASFINLVVLKLKYFNYSNGSVQKRKSSAVIWEKCDNRFGGTGIQCMNSEILGAGKNMFLLFLRLPTTK